MGATVGRWLLASVLVMVLAQAAPAGPYLGDWGWLWHPAPDCPRGEYCPLHYGAPEIYTTRAWFHKQNLDMYPPGPTPSPPVNAQIVRYPCRTAPPTPTSPYADPAGYFGRAPVPPVSPP
jgi:hypothetical protein